MISLTLALNFADTFGLRYQPSYVGDMANIRWWSRAATDEEIAVAAQAGQP